MYLFRRHLFSLIREHQSSYVSFGEHQTLWVSFREQQAPCVSFREHQPPPPCVSFREQQARVSPLESSPPPVSLLESTSPPPVSLLESTSPPPPVSLLESSKPRVSLLESSRPPVSLLESSKPRVSLLESSRPRVSLLRGTSRRVSRLARMRRGPGTPQRQIRERKHANFPQKMDVDRAWCRSSPAPELNCNCNQQPKLLLVSFPQCNNVLLALKWRKVYLYYNIQ